MLNFTGCSHHSYLGVSPPSDIVKKYKLLGAEYATITEYGNINSAVEFYSKAVKEGIKPIIGIQMWVYDTWTKKTYKRVGRGLKEQPRLGLVTVHFKDEAAYQKFCELTPEISKRVVKEGYVEKTYMTLDEIKSLGNITVGLSGLEGLVGRSYADGALETAEKIISYMREAFSDLYIEISARPSTQYWFKPMFSYGRELLRKGQFQENDDSDLSPNGDYQAGFNKFMVGMSEKYSIPILPSLDFHFLDDSQKIAQDAKLSEDGVSYIKLSTSHKFLDLKETVQLYNSMGFKQEVIMGWMRNLKNWASKFDDFRIKTMRDRWVLPVMEEESIRWLFEKISEIGRYNPEDPIQKERVMREVKTLAKNGVIDVIPYFKPLFDLSQWCRDNGILYNLRGSASGCFIIYLLGISGVNPLKHDLSFERFINEGRIKALTMPDVDMDIGDRDAVIEHLQGVFGDNIMQLSVDVVAKLKTAIRDAERAYLGSVRSETESLCASLPSPPQGADDYEFVFGYEDETGAHNVGIIETNPALQSYAKSNSEIWSTVTELLGSLRNKSSHACAFVITDKPVSHYAPIISVGKRQVTGFSPKSIEEAGLIKYDFLGVNTLKDIGLTLKILKDRGVDLDIYNLPDDDDVYKEFELGNTETVFQFNTVTVIPGLRALRPKSIDDLSNITALYRPGTMDAPESRDSDRTLVQAYIERATGREPTSYVHEDLEPILKDTFGAALFQEQTIEIFRQIAGYTAEQAETVRRGIGKKIESVLKSAIGDLEKSCIERGWRPDQIELLIDQIMASSRYSFNKSHAASYAYIGYACQYLKTKYPLEWWSSVLNNASKSELPKFWDYCGDLVLLPDINLSGDGWQIEGDKIRAPINILNGVGIKAYEWIVRNGPFKDIGEMVMKIKNTQGGNAVHKGVMIKLIASGVVDSLFSPDIKNSIQDKIYQYLKVKAELEGKSIPEDVPEEFINMNEITKYKTVKEIIPIISMDLRRILLPRLGATPPKLRSSFWFYNKKAYVNGSDMDFLLKKALFDHYALQKIDGNIYTLSYVLDEKTKPYHNKTKQMTQILIDTDGQFTETVVWPEWETSVAKSGFRNQIVEIKWKINKKRQEWSIKDIRVI